MTSAILSEPPATRVSSSAAPKVRYNTVKVDDVDIFYREAGASTSPVLLLLHGFPTSSNMFRNVIVQLARTFRVIAPDYPGYGFSGMPDHKTFEYTFANMTEVMDKFVKKLSLERYIVYLMDYGAPIGLRLALKHPEQIAGLIVQNGNAYEEGLREFWDPIKKYWKEPTPENFKGLFLDDPNAIKWQYTNGVPDLTLLDPVTWTVDKCLMDRLGNAEIQLDMLYDYGTNPPLYPDFQAFFRKYQPPTLIVWGKNDTVFPAEGAVPYKRDLPEAEIHLIDTGHFALETHADEIVSYIQEFFGPR
ncbi:MAG TPA: alpha/beta hydrolase [Acidisarcina sp.]